MKKISTFVLAVVTAACTTGNKEEPFAKEQAIVEKNLRAFDPNFNSDSTRLNIVLTFKVSEGVMEEKPVSVNLVTGGANPYVPVKGTFEVKMLNEKLEVLRTIFVENPLMVTPIDPPFDKEPPQTIRNGEVQVILPFHKDMAFIQFSDTHRKDFKPLRVELRPFLKELLREK